MQETTAEYHIAQRCGNVSVKNALSITELQKQHPDVTFIGVDSFEREPDEVEPFIKEMGEKMAYRVALDDVPEGAKPEAGAMARTWMDPAEEDRIPRAFVVDGESKVVWIGHPEGLDTPLAKILDGSYDIKAVAAERAKQKALERKLKDIDRKLDAVGEDDEAALKIYDEAFAREPELEQRLCTSKYLVLARRKAWEKETLEYGRRINKRLGQNPQVLNILAWYPIDPKLKTEPSPKVIAFALDLARRADVLADGKEYNVADTYARALFLSGQYKEAYEVQKRAVSLLKGSPEEEYDAPDFQARLEAYRKAAGIEALPADPTGPQPQGK